MTNFDGRALWVNKASKFPNQFSLALFSDRRTDTISEKMTNYSAGCVSKYFATDHSSKSENVKVKVITISCRM